MSLLTLYRAINFYNLQFSISEDTKELWAELSKKHTRKQWWTNPNNSSHAETILSDIVWRNGNLFIENSRKYSALNGGRYNAQKSHGVLYCSQNPLLATLEVAYHIFINARRNLNSFKKFEDGFTNALNIKLPKNLDFIIAVLCLQCDTKNAKILDLTTVKDLKKLCRRIGFDRYVDDSFDSDFIFGNDYDVGNAVGSYAISKKYDALKVGSARSDVDYYHFNILDTNDLNPKLKPNYMLYRCEVNPGEKRQPHRFKLTRLDAKDDAYIFQLDNIPLRSTSRGSHLKVYPEGGQNRLEKARVITVQKFR